MERWCCPLVPSPLRGPVDPLEEAVPEELWPPGDGNDGLLYGNMASSETGPFFCPLLLSSPLSMDPSLSWACWWRSSEVRACRSKELLISSRPIMGCLSKEEALRSEGLGMFLAPWTRAVWQGGGSGGGGRSSALASRRCGAVPGPLCLRVGLAARWWPRLCVPTVLPSVENGLAGRGLWCRPLSAGE